MGQELALCHNQVGICQSTTLCGVSHLQGKRPILGGCRVAEGADTGSIIYWVAVLAD